MTDADAGAVQADPRYDVPRTAIWNSIEKRVISGSAGESPLSV